MNLKESLLPLCQNVRKKKRSYRINVKMTFLKKVQGDLLPIKIGVFKLNFQDSLLKHEAICNFRRNQCVHLNCKERVVFNGLLGHILVSILIIPLKVLTPLNIRMYVVLVFSFMLLLLKLYPISH